MAMTLPKDNAVNLLLSFFVVVVCLFRFVFCPFRFCRNCLGGVSDKVGLCVGAFSRSLTVVV